MEVTQLDLLTPSEKRALRQLLVDHDQKAVARSLGLSPETVKTHLRNAREKCGCTSSFALAKVLIEYEQATPFRGIPPQRGEWIAALGPIPVQPARKFAMGRRGDEIREERTAFSFADLHDDPPARSGRDGTAALKRLLLTGALILVLIVAIILAFPLSESFQRLANAIEAPTS